MATKLLTLFITIATPTQFERLQICEDKEVAIFHCDSRCNRNAFTQLCAYLGQAAPAFVQWCTVHGVVAWLCLCPSVGEVIRNDSMHSDSSGYADEEVSHSRRWQKSLHVFSLPAEFFLPCNICLNKTHPRKDFQSNRPRRFGKYPHYKKPPHPLMINVCPKCSYWIHDC